MPENRRARRGSYAKGIVRREEILSHALQVIAKEGYRSASLRALSEAVGLSQAGLLHYFDSKEEMFAEILRKRDEVDAEHTGMLEKRGPDLELREGTDLAEVRDGFLGIIRLNSKVPGLVELFSRMAVDAAAPDHPAHEFFLNRGANRRQLLATTFRAAQQDGRISTAVDPDTLSRVFQAVAEGLQLQWMLDPDIDMAATAEALFELIAPRADDPPARPRVPDHAGARES